MTSSCGCDTAPDEYAQVDVLADEDAPDLGVDPRGDKVTVWSSLLAPIGVETGDGRRFADQALTHRDLPLPLRWHREDEGGHKKVVVVGTIDDVEYRADGVYGSGVLFDPDPEQMPRLAEDVAEVRLLLDKKAIGPSVDLDDMEYSVLEAAPDANPNARQKVDVTKGRISAATLVQIPAFAETRGVELHEVDALSYAASRAVMASAAASYEEVISIPEWSPTDMLAGADDPDLAGRIFAWLDDEGLGYYPIRKWVEGRPVVVREAAAFALRALDLGAPDTIPDDELETLRGRLAAYATHPLDDLTYEDEEALVASAAPVKPPAAWFTNPELDGPTPLTVTEDGRVFGHLATWRTCHTGVDAACVTAPKSRASYAYFHTGEVVTAEGEPVAVGRVTLGGGHADTRLGFQAAIDHYDNAGACVALVRAGEDKHGIWMAGALTPEADELKAAALRRHPPSGDWRRIGGNLELIGALAVNTPGFPVPRARVAGGAPQALVAAGALAAPDDLLDETGHFSADAVREAVMLAVRAERQRERRTVAVADAFAEATEAEVAAERRERAVRAAGTFAMPAFIKKKVEARKAEEPECDDDDEECKKKKAAKKLPFGGKKAPSFADDGTVEEFYGIDEYGVGRIFKRDKDGKFKGNGGGSVRSGFGDGKDTSRRDKDRSYNEGQKRREGEARDREREQDAAAERRDAEGTAVTPAQMRKMADNELGPLARRGSPGERKAAKAELKRRGL